MNLLYLGRCSSFHAQNSVSVFSDMGYNVTVVNTNPQYRSEYVEGLQRDFYVHNWYEKRDRIGFGYGWMVWFEMMFFNKLMRNSKIREVIRENKIDIVYSQWASAVFPEIVGIRKFNVPVIHSFLSYPNFFSSRWEVDFENFWSKGIVNNLEGRIYGTKRMMDYMKSKFDLTYGQDLIFLECFSEKYFYRKRLPLLSEKDGEPHIIFIGTGDFGKVGDVNDIRTQIKSFVKEKIHIHVVESKLSDSGFESKYLHTFKPFDARKGELMDGSLATLMTQFDACVVTYNFQRGYCIDRFYNSTPTRFLFALTAGIPIVLPMGFLTGCEDIIREHENGFTYMDSKDLRDKLGNEELMKWYRENAIRKSHNFTFEKNFKELDGFVKKIVCDFDQDLHKEKEKGQNHKV